MVFITGIGRVWPWVRSHTILGNITGQLAMATDTAFFDRMHYYLPGWEIPKMRPEFFTDGYGFIVDYLAEFFREVRKRPFQLMFYEGPEDAVMKAVGAE